MLEKDERDYVRNYVECVSRLDLCENAIESLKLNFDTIDDIQSNINEIKKIIDKEILYKRKEIIHEYGCITDYIQFINDLESEHYEEGTEEKEQADSAIGDFVEQIDSLFTDIENKSIELESYIDAGSFCDSIINYAELSRSIDNKVRSDIQSIIK